MAYGTMLADTFQSSTANTAPVIKDGNSAEIGQVCKAWINFDGTLSTPIAARASFNMSSVTKNGTGDYTVNFTISMADANHSPMYVSGRGDATNNYGFQIYPSATYGSAMTALTVRVVSYIQSTSAAKDGLYNNLSVFR